MDNIYCLAEGEYPECSRIEEELCDKGTEKRGHDIRREKRRELRQQQLKKRIMIAGAVSAVLVAAFTYGASHKDKGYSVVSKYQVVTREDQNLLVLVNKTHALPEGYEVNLHWLENGSCAVAEEMYDALRQMLTDGSVDGREFVVASGYRDGAVQQQLLEEDIAASMANEGLTWQEAYEKETKETMPPGYSEHETGLAVDLVALDYQILDRGQETTPENIWLRENCSKYGFILRYPEGREDITQINYEPWHFRYVGTKAAEEITEQGITLEEYLQNQ